MDLDVLVSDLQPASGHLQSKNRLITTNSSERRVLDIDMSILRIRLEDGVQR